MYRLYKDNIKKLGLTTELKKVPPNNTSFIQKVMLLAEPNTSKKDLEKAAKDIDKSFKFAIAMMRKHKFVSDIDLSRIYWGLETYKNPDDDIEEDEILINYRHMWTISLYFAAGLFYKRSYKLNFLNRDLITISLLYNYTIFSNKLANASCSNWNEHRDCMIDAMTRDVSSINFCTAFALRSMDFDFVRDHKDIFNALSKEDSAALEEILAR